VRTWSSSLRVWVLRCCVALMDVTVAAMNSLVAGSWAESEAKLKVVACLMESVAQALNMDSAFAQASAHSRLPPELDGESAAFEDSDGAHVWMRYLTAHFQRSGGVKLTYQARCSRHARPAPPPDSPADSPRAQVILLMLDPRQAALNVEHLSVLLLTLEQGAAQLDESRVCLTGDATLLLKALPEARCSASVPRSLCARVRSPPRLAGDAGGAGRAGLRAGAARRAAGELAGRARDGL